MKNNFDWAAEFYDESRNIPESLTTQIGKGIKANLDFSPENSILEVGTGTGRILLPIKKYLNPKIIIGIDISYLMLREFSLKLKNNSFIHLVQADGYNLPFAQTTQFNIIITSHIVHLVPDPERFVKTLLNYMRQYYIDIAAYVNHHITLPFKLYYEKLARNGYSYSPRGKKAQKKISSLLAKRNLQESILQYKAKQSISFVQLLNFLSQRVFSHHRIIPDFHHERALAYTISELRKRRINLTSTVEIPATATISIYSLNA